jgi:hypothetical protein
MLSTCFHPWPTVRIFLMLRYVSYMCQLVKAFLSPWSTPESADDPCCGSMIRVYVNEQVHEPCKKNRIMDQIGIFNYRHKNIINWKIPLYFVECGCTSRTGHRADVRTDLGITVVYSSLQYSLQSTVYSLQSTQAAVCSLQSTIYRLQLTADSQALSKSIR